MSNAKRKKGYRFINILLVILIVVAVCTLGFSAYKLISINQSYEEASNLYADIEAIIAAPAQTVENERTTVKSSAPELKPEDADAQTEADDAQAAGEDAEQNDRQDTAEEETGAEEAYDVEGLKFTAGTAINDFHAAALSWNFDALLGLCEDSVGYIYQKDTMSYPIVQAEDNDKYLRHLINGEYNTAGTLFVDFRCQEGLEGRYSIVYGHNMDDGSMLGSVTRYSEEEYYKQHPYFDVFVGKDQYIYYVYAAARVEEDSDVFTFDMNDEEFLDVLAEVRSLTPYEMMPLKVTENSHVIVLSTCIDYPRNYDYRYIIVLVREKQMLDASYGGKLPWVKSEVQDKDPDQTETGDQDVQNSEPADGGQNP